MRNLILSKIIESSEQEQEYQSPQTTTVALSLTSSSSSSSSFNYPMEAPSGLINPNISFRPPEIQEQDTEARFMNMLKANATGQPKF